MKTTLVFIVLLVALTTMGFECINEDLLVSVNVKGITGSYAVNPGNATFNDCTTILSSDYLDPDYTDIKDVRISDIKVSTVGSYAGNVVAGARVTVNGTDILRLSTTQPWSYFNTPRSIITDPNIQRVPAGILTLINAVKNKQNVVICGIGSVSLNPVPSGLLVRVEVFGQVDASL